MARIKTISVVVIAVWLVSSGLGGLLGYFEPLYRGVDAVPVAVAGQDSGNLRVIVTDAATGQAIPNAKVSIVEAGLSVLTDGAGLTDLLSLPAPDRALSFQPEGPPFYSEYTVDVEAGHYRSLTLRGVRIIAGEEAHLYGRLNRPDIALDLGTGQSANQDEIIIPPHALMADWAGAGVQGYLSLGPGEASPLNPAATPSLQAMESVPLTIVVHDGSPDDATAPNISVPFEDYVKGVLPNEWISSWSRYPDSLLSGALAVRSYAIAVVRSGKWRNRGYPFDIVSTTADQVWDPVLRYASTDAAVDATAGRYIAYGGYAINAQYRAHTGSPTKDGGLPYLSSVWDQVEADHGYSSTIGPGLSQWGSYWWAELGQKSDWIVKHYYSGVILAPASVKLLLSVPSLVFLSAPASNGGTAKTQSILVTDDAGGGVPWSASASSDLGWLSVQATGNQTAASLLVTAAPAVNGVPLPPGVYQGTVTLSAPSTANPTLTVPISLVVSESIRRTYFPKMSKLGS